MRTLQINLSCWLFFQAIFPAAIVAQDSLELLLATVPAQFDKKSESVERKLSVFREKAEKHKTLLFKQLDVVSNNALNAGGAVAATMIAQVQIAKRWVEDGGELEDCGNVLQWLFIYAECVARDREGITPAIQLLMRDLNRDGHHDLTLKLEEAFANLGGIAGARTVIKDNTVFKGFRTSLNGADLIPLRFEFNKVLDDKFVGKVERDWMYTGHPVHALGGKVHGLKMMAQTGDTLAFGNNLDGRWNYEAYVIGKSIVGCYYGATRKGKAGCGYFHVKLR